MEHSVREWGATIESRVLPSATFFFLSRDDVPSRAPFFIWRALRLFKGRTIRIAHGREPMHKTLIHISLLALSLALSAGTVRAADPLQPYPVKGQVVQRLNAFDNPEGAIFSADGQSVFIWRSAELGMPDKGVHWTYRGGYSSKLAVLAGC